jgi:hypothetical protein
MVIYSYTELNLTERRSRVVNTSVRIRKLGPETHYPDLVLLFRFSVPPGKFRDNTWNLATAASFHIISSSSYI